ncbi:MAG: DUF1080 domain-containing protein [Acidobacteria bacterium]|nr:DUF1080 domain-containing protein [Acidobacteriota bacterium]
MKHSVSFAANAAAPAVWIDLLRESTWTRVPIPLTGTLREGQPWHFDRSTGILLCAGHQTGHEWYRFDREFADFDLHLESRYVPAGVDEKKYNSGVFVRNSKTGSIWHQVQIGAGSGGYFFGRTPVLGEVRGLNLRSEMLNGELVKPAGEWNIFDIRADRGKLTLTVNGKVSSIMDCQVASGFVGLEAEGYAIEFRNVKIKALE